jgi:hypothetical protein
MSPAFSVGNSIAANETLVAAAATAASTIFNDT